jgi:hypothetical protein
LIRAADNYAAALANNRGRKIGSKVPVVVTPSHGRTQCGSKAREMIIA